MKLIKIIVFITFFRAQDLYLSPVSITDGGTELTTITAHNLLIGNDIASPTLLAPAATSGIPLVSQGSATNPSYTTARVAGGGTGLTSVTPYAIICGGTTSTANLQQIATLGSSGQVLTSAGSGTLPSWATPINIQSATITLTRAQILTLRATPITIVPAQGAGTTIQVLFAACTMNYGGSSVYTASAGQTIRIGYVDTAGSQIIGTALNNGGIVASTSQFAAIGLITGNTGVITSGIENQNVVVYNSVATEISGNTVPPDNTITVTVLYTVLTL